MNLKLKSSIIMTIYFGLFAVQAANKQPVDFVDNFIGVRSKGGNCIIGPQLPFGSISPSPQTKNGNDDGYNPKESIRGFGQLHVSGTGWGTNGQIFVSPQIGLAVAEESHDSPKSDESAKPYEYSVKLNRYNIKTSITPSFHSAIYKFQFPKSDSAHVILDITHNIPMDIKTIIGGKVYEGDVKFENDNKTTLVGYGKYEGGFGEGPYTVYFAAEFSKTPVGFGTWLNGKIQPYSSEGVIKNLNDRVGAFLQFKTAENEIIYLKISVSYKCVEQAKAWLAAEIPDWNYEKVKKDARDIWNKTLGKIEVEGGTEKDKRLFYTAFYHANLMPCNRTNDTNNFGKDVPMWDNHFAVWDTWRTMYPLQVIVNPEMVAGTVNSFIARFAKNGKVKDAFINGNEMTMEQGGNNVDNIIADAYLKCVKGINWNEAYKVLKFNADNERLGSFSWEKKDILQNKYKQLGWIPAGTMSSSMTLEYAYNDYCASEVAKGLGKKDDAEKYLLRSGQWTNLWDENAVSDGFKGWIGARDLNGTFVDFDLKKNQMSWENYFYEGSSWDYSWFMPHQFSKLVNLCGGKEKFVERLKHGFENKLISYDNEPAFLAVQAFHYGDRPDLTSFYTRKLMVEKFTEEGTVDNDDSGAMSAWYMFSAMGFFPNAGQNFYYLNGPLFTKTTIHLANGKKLIINAPNASNESIYVKSVKINGKSHKASTFTHDMIINGGTIEFEMKGK